MSENLLKYHRGERRERRVLSHSIVFLVSATFSLYQRNAKTQGRKGAKNEPSESESSAVPEVNNHEQ